MTTIAADPKPPATLTTNVTKMWQPSGLTVEDQWAAIDAPGLLMEVAAIE